MGILTSEHFGAVELNHGMEHRFSILHPVHGVPVQIQLHIQPHHKPDRALMQKLDYRLNYLPEIVDQLRELIHSELHADGSQVQQYRHFHCNGVDAERRWETYGVSDEIDDDTFVRALRLDQVIIQPGEPERYYVMRFSLGEHFSDEILVASADAEGLLDDEIIWES